MDVVFVRVIPPFALRDFNGLELIILIVVFLSIIIIIIVIGVAMASSYIIVIVVVVVIVVAVSASGIVFDNAECFSCTNSVGLQRRPKCIRV